MKLRYLNIFVCLVLWSDFDFVVALDSDFYSEFVEKFLTKRFLYNVQDFKKPSTCSSNPEEEMTTTELIRHLGYPAEEHSVTTEDGYILELHRIPGKQGSPVVLLHHGMLDSSFAWIALGKERALAYKLADSGYDVWLANARGNTYSRKHVSLTPLDPEFWNYSYHEIGKYDLPAEIDYITSLTAAKTNNSSNADGKGGNSKLIYIGHSMGTTVFFVMAIERPDFAGSRVEAMFGLAPAAFTGNVKGFGKIVEPPVRSVQEALNLDGRNEFLTENLLTRIYGKCVCNRSPFAEICRDLIFSTVGFHSRGFDTSLLPLILTHTPAGISLKTLFHYGLGVRSKKFQQYDYGSPQANLRVYNDTKPPDYDLRKIQVPIALFWGQNDFLTPPEDVARLYRLLPKKIEMYKVEDPDWNHLDFIWSNYAPRLLYQRLLNLVDRYSDPANGTRLVD